MNSTNATFFFPLIGKLFFLEPILPQQFAAALTNVKRCPAKWAAGSADKALFTFGMISEWWQSCTLDPLPFITLVPVKDIFNPDWGKTQSGNKKRKERKTNGFVSNRAGVGLQHWRKWFKTNDKDVKRRLNPAWSHFLQFGNALTTSVWLQAAPLSLHVDGRATDNKINRFSVCSWAQWGTLTHKHRNLTTRQCTSVDTDQSAFGAGEKKKEKRSPLLGFTV